MAKGNLTQEFGTFDDDTDKYTEPPTSAEYEPQTESHVNEEPIAEKIVSPAGSSCDCKIV